MTPAELLAIVKNGGTLSDKDAKAVNDFYGAGTVTQRPPGGTGSQTTVTGGAGAPGPVAVQPGLDWALEQEKIAIQKYIADISASTAVSVANINAAAANRDRQAAAELQAKLAAGQITSQEFMQKRDLAQRESEFARDLALRQLTADRTDRLQQAQQRLQELDQARQERLLQAQLSSNPADTVLYEFYKRGLTGGATAQAFSNAQRQAQGAPQEPQGTQIKTGDYPAVTAYGDQTMQQLAQFVQNPNTTPESYNPNLTGKGAFGATIAAPNTMSRQGFNSLDPTQMAILTSFLKAGIQTNPNDPNSRIAINPEDYFKQMQNSWVPTINQTVTPATATYS